MANRHLSRSVVMQSLFELDFRNAFADPALAADVLTRNADEFAPGMGDRAFMKSLQDNILKKRPELDLIIEKAAPEWPIDKISVVDRNILRLGLFELLFSDRGEVPAKVAINEAIELAKTFGGDTSGRFVNGVLGAVYKEIGEPGKDEKSKKERDMTPDHLAPIERLGGAVVYAHALEGVMLAFVHDIFKHWTLSKGKIEPGEDVLAGTRREVHEEMGLDIEIKGKLGENAYITFNKEKKKIKKHVMYFLAESKYVPLKLEPKGGLDDTRWFPLSEVDKLALYDDLIPLITKGIKIILGQETLAPINLADYTVAATTAAAEAILPKE